VDVSGSEPVLATRAPGGSDASRLYERDEALATLEGRVTAARRGEGRAVFFVGEAGQGKTTLLDVAREYHGHDLTLRAARGNAMESDLPFAFMEQVLDFFSAPSGDEEGEDTAGVVGERHRVGGARSADRGLRACSQSPAAPGR